MASGSTAAIAHWTPTRLQRQANDLNEAPLERVLSWALEIFSPGVCLATSFGPQSIVLMHRIAELRPQTTVFYLDTGLLFPETYELRDRLAERLSMQFVRVSTPLSMEAQQEQFGDALWSRHPDLCCHLRKVLPLRRFLSDKQAWITGVRNGHNKVRADTRLVEWDGVNGLVKINPLAHWNRDRIWDYLRRHDLPYNPLHDDGYPSIGCSPCTRRVRPGDDPRSGRWPGFGKTECGIHHSHSGLIRLEDAGSGQR